MFKSACGIILMANQSAKKNEIKNVGRVKYVSSIAIALVTWYIIF